MSNALAQVQILAAYARARWLTSRLKTRADVKAWRHRQLVCFLAGPVARVPAFKDMAHRPLDAFRVQDKASMMSRFEHFNRLGLTAQQARQHWQDGTAPRGYSVGASTGTSGNRGFYVVSDAERYAWLGVILARGLPGFWRERLKVAVMLPANSRLYDAANESRRLALRFFDLHEGVETQAGAVEAWAPDVLIAPPKVLRLLSQRDSALAPRQIFSGAEVLDPIDRTLIERRFGCTVREIYMATEGLFAIACPHGRLHLLEDYMAFEWEADPSGGPLVSPLITDFTRQSQIMVRYRMNDLLELDDQACPCGSPFTGVKSVVGRMDDILELSGCQGGLVAVTPDILRNAIIDSDAGIDDFRVLQTAPSAIRVTLPPHASNATQAVEQSLASLLKGLGASAQVELRIDTLPPPDSHKLRRVSRVRS